MNFIRPILLPIISFLFNVVPLKSGETIHEKLKKGVLFVNTKGEICYIFGKPEKILPKDYDYISGITLKELFNDKYLDI